MKERILSTLLCICMMLTLLPVTSLAEGETIDWSAMYTDDSIITPTPSSWSDHKVVWSAADGGVKMTGAFSTDMDWYYGIMLNVPDDAYYNLDFTLTGDSSSDASNSGVGYIVGNSVLGPYHDGYTRGWGVETDSNEYKNETGLDNGYVYENSTPKSWTLTGLKGTNVQLDYIMVTYSDASDDNYMIISDVKFTRLTNAITVTPGGTGSGSFDVFSDADFNETGAGMNSTYSADIGRGSQITLTAHPTEGSYFDHWEGLDGTSISTDTTITVTVGDSATDDTDKAYNPVFGSGTHPNVTRLLDDNVRNELEGDSLRITHMGSTWEPLFGTGPLYSSINSSSTTGSALTLDMTMNVENEDSVFYGLVHPGFDYSAYEAYLNVSVDGTTYTAGGACSYLSSSPNYYSFAIPVTTGSHTVSVWLKDAGTMARLVGLGLVSGENRYVTLKATDYNTLDGCESYTVTVNGTDVTEAVKSADGYIAPYGSVAQFEAVNADVAKYAFQNWSTGDYSATSVIPDVDTVGKGQLVLRDNVTLTPVYTEGVSISSAIMADPTEIAPDGGTYQWTMNSAAYFSVNEADEESKVAIAEGGVLTLEFNIPEGEAYMSRIQGNCAFKLYKGETELGSNSSNFPTGYYYSVLDTGSYKMVFTGRDTGVLDNFTCQPYESMNYGKVTVTAEQTDLNNVTIDATQALTDSGALPEIEHIFYQLDTLAYVADGYINKVIKEVDISDLSFILDKTKLEAAGLAVINADKTGGGTVSFNTNGTTLTVPYSNFIVSRDGEYSYNVNVNLNKTSGYPYLSGTTLYANGCPIYVEDGGDVYFYNPTDESHTEPVNNLDTNTPIRLGSGAIIYGGSNKSDVASTYVYLAYSNESYTVYGGGNGYGVTGNCSVISEGGAMNMINGGNNGSGTLPASISVSCQSSGITAANGVTGGSATGDVTVTAAYLEGDLTGGSSENGTVMVNAGTADYHTITGDIIGVPVGGSASNVVINTVAAISGGIFGARNGSNVGNITLNVNGNVGGAVITGVENATVTGDVTVNVTAADIGDTTSIYGQYYSNVNGDVSVTVNGGSAFGCANIFGSSSTTGKEVTGKVTVKTNGVVATNLLGSTYGSVGSVEVTTNGDVSGSVTGLSGGSAGAVTVTTNNNVTDAVLAVRDGSATGDVSLTVNAQAKSAAAIQAVNAAASVGGNVTQTMGENASLTGDTVTSLTSILSTSDSIKATVAGDVTLNQRMTALADIVTLSDRDENSDISGTSTINVYKDNGKQVLLRGGNISSIVNIYALYSKPVYVPQNAGEPVLDSSVSGGYFVKTTSDQSGFDLYFLVNLNKPIVDEARKLIIGNGFPLKVRSGGIDYDSGVGWQSIATGDLSAYTVYAGAEQVDVSNSSITFSGVSAQSPGTYFGGGVNSDVTGTISIKLESINPTGEPVSTDFGRPVTIYGGSENADVTGNLNVSLNYDEKAVDTQMVTWFAGCKNGNFNGSAQFDIQRDDTYEKDEDDTSGKAFTVFKLPGTFYLCSENGTFSGSIDLYTGALDYRTDITGGIHDAYSTTGKSTGYNTIHMLSYTDSTETPITRTSDKTTVTGDSDLNLKSAIWDNGTAVLSYHVVLTTLDEYTTIAEITDTAENYILYADGGLYCDRGTVGEEDNADVLIRGFAKQYLPYYFGTESNKLPVNESLICTMDKTARVKFYMNGPLTLNLNTDLDPYNSNANGVTIGDTAESVLLTIGRVDGGAEHYTINSTGMWYSGLIINKPFDSYHGIPIKEGNAYNEDDITLNLDKSKYATEKNAGTFGGTYCRLKEVSPIVVEPPEEPVSSISADGDKLEGHVLIFADGGVNYAAVDTDKDGELDDTENAVRVEITDYYPDALPGSHITMLSGSLDFFYFYGETFTQKGGSVNTIFAVYPASESATIRQEDGCTLPYITIKSASETSEYPANPTCVINVEIGGFISEISSKHAANIKLLSTADPGLDSFTFDKDDTFGTLDFSEYILKYLDATNGYYTDINYYYKHYPIKPTDPATLKIIGDASNNNHYCPDTTTGSVDIVNVSADFRSVYYSYDTFELTPETFNMGIMYPNVSAATSQYFDITYEYDSEDNLNLTVKPKSGLEPGIYKENCIIHYIYDVSKTLEFPASITVLPQTVIVTPNDGLVSYAGSGNTSWKQGYTLSPAVTLPDADKDLLVYYGEATVGKHELHLGKTCSNDNRYDFELAAGTYYLTISDYDGNNNYPIDSAVATVPDTWGAYALITAPDGYLVSLTEDGNYTKSVKWNASSSTQPQNDITYYIKDNTEGSESYLLTLSKTIDGVKVCTNGDLATYSAVTIDTSSTAANVTFTTALNDSTAGACGLSEIRVLAVAASSHAPSAAEVLTGGTVASVSGDNYMASIAGLLANTEYTFYAAHLTEAGVAKPDAVNLGSRTTLGYTPTVTDAPAATGVYGTPLSDLSLAGGTVAGQNDVTLTGTWKWTQTNAGATYPKVGGNIGYEATFTPNDTQYLSVIAQVIPAMTPKEITVLISSAGTITKYYDGEASVSLGTALDSLTLEGVRSGDVVSVAAEGVTAAFADSYAGENKAVTLTGNLTLSGEDANCYTLIQPTGFTGAITAAAQQPVITGAAEVPRGGQILDLNGLVTDAPGVVSLTISGDTNGCTLNNGILTSGANIGTVKINVNAAAKDINNDGNAEYAVFEQTDAITVTIKDKSSQSLIVTQQGCTYGETLANPVYTKPDGTSDVILSYTGTLRKGGSYSSATKPTEAGAYTVMATCESASAVYEGTSGSFIIAPKSISDADIMLGATLTYNGSQQTQSVTSVTIGGNTLDAGEYSVSGNTGADAESYTLTITAAEAGNYTGSTTKAFAIAPAPLSITSATVEGRGYRKDDTSVTITGVTFIGASLSKGSDYTAAGTMTNAIAGNGKQVNVTVTMINSNYTLSSNTITTTADISKAEAVTLTNWTASHRYNLTGEQTITVANLMPNDVGTLTYTKGTASGKTTIVSDWSVETDGTVKYSLTGSGAVDDSVILPVKINSTNYAESTVNVVITLSDKEDQAAPISRPSEVVKMPTIPITTGNGKLNVEASIKDSTATIFITDKQIDEIVSDKGTEIVKLDVSNLDVKAVTIPSNVITAAGKSETFTEIEIKLPTGSLTLDKTALDAVSSKNGNVTISLEKVDSTKLTDTQRDTLGNQAGTAVIVDVNVFAGGKKLSAFGGGRVGISVPYTPKSGEDTSKLTIWFIKDDGTIEPKNGIYNAVTGCVDFTTEHLSRYMIVRFPFEDVAEDAWYYGSVAYANNNGLFSGTGEATFSPDSAMTREMIWMVLARMDGKTPRNMDGARAWAMTSGISDGSDPSGFITREQMATILHRYASYKKYDTTLGGMAIREYADYDSISGYALTAMGWSVNTGLVHGSNSKLMPRATATRAQVAAILQRFCQNALK